MISLKRRLSTAICDQLIGCRAGFRSIGPKLGLNALQKIALRKDMQFAIDDPHDHLITIGESKFAAHVSRELQPATADKPSFVRVYCTVFSPSTA